MTTTQDFGIIDTCNNYCGFCSGEGQVDKCSLEEIKYELMRAKEKNVTRVDISGGEPTISPNLFPILHFCKRLNFETIYIKTNGRKLKDFEFVKKMVELGANSFLVSLHGHNDETNDKSTGIPGSFKETVQGLHNLIKLGAKFTTLTVVNKANYNYLPEIAEFAFSNFNVGEHNFAFTYPVARAEKNFDDVVPYYRETKPYFAGAAEVVKKRGKTTSFDNVPLCFLPGIERYANFLNKNDPCHSHHDFGPRCKDCIYLPICEGVPPKYTVERGWDEFDPVTEQGLPNDIEIPPSVTLNEDYRCVTNCIYANKVWGAVLISWRTIVLPVTEKGYTIYKACDGHTTLKEMQEKFGDEAMGFLHSLYKRGLIRYLTPNEKANIPKIEPIAFIARKHQANIWLRDILKKDEEAFEFPLYRKRPDYPKVNLVSSAAEKKAMGE